MRDSLKKNSHSEGILRFRFFMFGIHLGKKRNNKLVEKPVDISSDC